MRLTAVGEMEFLFLARAKKETNSHLDDELPDQPGMSLSVRSMETFPAGSSIASPDAKCTSSSLTSARHVSGQGSTRRLASLPAMYSVMRVPKP